MLQCSKIATLFFIVVQVLALAHLGSACFRAIGREVNGTQGNGNFSCCSNGYDCSSQTRIVSYGAMNCTKDSKLKFVGLELNKLAKVRCNGFSSGKNSQSYTCQTGETTCSEVLGEETYAYASFDGYSTYIASGTLQGPVCQGARYYFFNSFSTNRVGSCCCSKNGLEQIQAPLAKFIVIGGNCTSECSGTLIVNYCPGAY